MILSIDDEESENIIRSYENCSTDVVIIIDEEDFGQKVISKYVASFFSFNRILSLNAKYAKSGEFLNGTYFTAKNMVLIDKCTHKNITKVVKHLIEEGDFIEVFKKL